MVYRKRAGLTKTELAEAANISVTTLSKYEYDEVLSPNIDTLYLLATALGVSINKLILGIEDPKARQTLESLIKDK